MRNTRPEYDAVPAPDSDPSSTRRRFLGVSLASALLVGAAEALANETPAAAATTYVPPRIVNLPANTTSVTLPSATADQVNLTTNQSGGALTVTTPSGTPVDGQRLSFRITSTPPTGGVPPTYAWPTTIRGSLYGALPISPTGQGLTDYFVFVWRASTAVWDMVAYVAGFA